jgi:hypothetical protein
MKKRWLLLVLGLGLALTFVVTGSDLLPIRFTFDETTEGWLPVPPPTGTKTTISLTDDPSNVKVGKRALVAHYSIEPRKLSGLAHPIDGLSGTGVRVWLKTDTATLIVLGLVERDGSGYTNVTRTLPGEWLLVETPFSEFKLGEDSKDENGQLDLDQANMLVIVDAGGFLPEAKGERTLWVDEYELADDIKSNDAEKSKPKSYVPLLNTGHPSESGARATTGITYLQGKFGLGVLTDAPGELVAVPIKKQLAEGEARKWRWDQGTIEMWISPRFDMSEMPDFAGLLTMQYEPFIAGFSGSLFIIYTKTHQIAFLMNGNMENIIATSPLKWNKGEWHHLAVSWGQQGMRFYLDGKVVAKNRYVGGPGTLTEDVVVGNHAWTLMSGKFANTVIDELRLSDKQRVDEEINESAKATNPLNTDNNTLALEHFDGQPLPPITLKPDDAPFHAVSVDKPVKLTVLMPKFVTDLSIFTNESLVYTVSTPSGVIISKDAIQLSQQNAFNLELSPFQNQGFYKISFQLEKDNEIINEGADWFRVFTGKVEKSDSALIFGASSCYVDPQDHEEFFRSASAVGVRSLRMPFEWAEIEPKDNKFVWDKYDRIVGWANKYNVELIPTFIWENPQPEWAGRGKAKKGTEEERYPPEDLKKWDDFVYQTVNRYKNSIHWWIPANEPNLSKYWHPKPDAKAYVQLLKATKDAVQRADPKAKILGCNVAGMDLLFLEKCFKEGALSYCDAIGVHPYICPHSPDDRMPINILDPMSPVGTFLDGLIFAKTLIEKYGGKQKLWLDEAGQPYRDDFIISDWGVSEEKAAEYLVKIYSESLASGAVERVLWFSFWGGEYGSFALLRPDGSPTLPMVAYANLASQLSGATFLKEGSRKDMRSLIFKKDDKEIELVWSPKGEKELQLQKNEQASNLYGFPLVEANTSRRLIISTQAVYLGQ